MPKKILLAGESWTSTATHIKGWDQFPSVTHHRGADAFIERLAGDAFAFDYMLCHEAAERFPASADALGAYDAVILSDIGANTLLMPPSVWVHSQRAPNRLRAVRDYVAKGGALIMVGGYYSFQGINGAARYRGTAVEDVLPVSIHPWDDRLEIPEGAEAVTVAGDHPVLEGVPGQMPFILGCNEVVAKPGATTLLALPEDQGSHPLLVLGEHGQGRSVAWTSDIGPHWLPMDVLDWAGFPPLWHNVLTWATRGI
jgi:uncharacterized membrane protein